MPATITHAYFTKDVYDILPDNIKKNICCSRIKMFGQSMDALIFYNLFSPLPGKKVRNFSKYFHCNQTQEYFINLVKYIKKNKFYQDVDVCSYLVGLICHYVLDSVVHPYIFYKTGFFNKKEPNTYKYNNIHEFMEIFIDNDMVKRREKTNPYRFPIGKFCFNLKPFSQNLKDTIDYSFDKTFNITNMNKIYYRSLKQMKFALNVFRRDVYGIKKFIYKLVDTFTTKRTFRFEAISYHYPLQDKHDFLNSNHSLWRNPTAYDVTSNESFVELYLKAIKLAKVLVCASFDYIYGKDIDLDKIFLNNSYITGINCDLKKELKYFEF